MLNCFTNSLTVACLIPALLLGAPACASGAGCLDLTPTAKQGRPPFSPMEVRELTQEEHDNVKALLKSLEGEWTGGSQEKSCNLTDAENFTTATYDLKSKVRVDHYGNFEMQVEFYSSKERTRHQKILRFYLDEGHLRVHHNNGAGDVELIDVAKNRIELVRRARVQNSANKGGIHREFFLVLEVRDNLLSIHRTTYTQGRMSAEEAWQLQRL